jgi:DNA-binding SARP family transcriptional activator/tetratricopeptide (TPR) repeat protein
MRARFQIRCLGAPSLLTIGGRTVRVRTRKELALLCYLALEQRWHTRDALAELLWPDRPHKESRHSLAVALSALRGKLGREILEGEHDRVRLHAEGIALDVDRLLAGDIVGSDTEVPLDVDGFLEGFEVPAAIAFAHWRDGQRGRLLPHVLDALVVLIDRCRRRGDFRQIETLALRLQRFEPLSEQAMRARMEARAFSGDRLTALRLFEQWKADLAAQLQAVPSDLVEGMALRLRRRGWERPGSVDIPTVHTDQWRDRPFVGRATEYRELYEAWEAVQRCEPAHRLILGDSGIGKSTLVERVTTAAGLEGATTARVQCHEAEREIPYAMISGLIAQLVERPGASATPPESLAELAQTIPGVRRRFPVLPAPLETQGDAARIRFTEATHALIGAVAEEHPVILVVDDVHHSDDVSLAVLHRVIRLSDHQAVLVYFLARPGELHQSPQASRLRDHGATLGIRQLSVGPLSRVESIELLDGILRDLQLTPSPTVRRTLLAAAAGFPLVLELLVNDWARGGDQSLPMALDAVTADLGQLVEPDDAYRMLVDRLVSHLDPTTRTVLDVAAVLGPRLNDTALYSVADLKVGEVMSGIGKLGDLRLLRDAVDRVEFANDLVRGHVYYRVHGLIRKLLHDRIATRLIDCRALGDETLDLEIAWHCMRCGRTTQAEAFLLQGSRTAVARGAIHEAERRLASAVGALHGSSRTEASLLLAEMLQEQGRYSESHSALKVDRVAASSPWGQALMLISDVRIDCSTANHDQHVAATLSLLSDTSGSRNAQVAAVRLAAHLVSKQPLQHVAAALHEALLSPHFHGWDGEDGFELATQRIYLGYFARLPAASNEATLGALADLIQRTSAHLCANRRSYRLLAGAALCHLRAARYPSALPLFEAALATARKLEDDASLGDALNQMANWYAQVGDAERALEYAEESLALDLQYSHQGHAFASYLAATASLLLGKPARAQELLERFSWIAATGAATTSQLWAFFRADLLWGLGYQTRAERVAREGFQIGNGEPLRIGTASTFNRWLAMLTAVGRKRNGLERCGTEATAIAPEDAWDHAENVSALLAIARAKGRETPALEAKLATHLGVLFPAIKTHLDRFGMPFC